MNLILAAISRFPFARATLTTKASKSSSLRDAEKLDYVRAVLKGGDLETVSRFGRVFEVKALAAE